MKVEALVQRPKTLIELNQAVPDLYLGTPL